MFHTNCLVDYVVYKSSGEAYKAPSNLGHAVNLRLLLSFPFLKIFQHKAILDKRIKLK